MNPDHLSADDYSALGAHPVMVVNAQEWRTPDVRVQSVIIGLDRAGVLPAVDADAFDVLLTTASQVPAPWVSVPPERFDAHVVMLDEAVHAFPVAATMLCQTLRLAERLPFADALIAESSAYSALLGGGEFKHWGGLFFSRSPEPVEGRSTLTTALRQAQGYGLKSEANPVEPEPADLILTTRDQGHITLTLNNPDHQNPMTAAMRDALYSALANALDDPTAPTVSLCGAGKCFSTGGHLPEFGTAGDLARAHIIRTTHSCARLIDALADRADVHFHGACVGSGLEVPVAAARRTAASDAWFQLPELRMGLIPGAGGTASVGRAIGRHRTAWMALSGKRINAARALHWGLVQAIIR